MNRNNYRPSFIRKLAPYVVLTGLFMFVLYFVLAGLAEAGSASDSEGKRIAEESIRRAVINCYASEGLYPPTFAYLVENYGIRIDEKKYVVHYEIFAENIMPEITVLKY